MMLRYRKNALRLGALALALVSAGVRAQLVDDVELRREGDDAVVQVRFVTPVQFQRTLVARSGDLGQVYYELLPTRDTLNLITSERRIPGGAGTPLLILTDEAAGGAERSRKLVLRFAGITNFVARAGAGNRSIELVLHGKGSSLVARAAPAPSPAAPATPLPGPSTEASSAPALERAQALLAAARQAMEKGEHTDAITRLDELLALPPNASTQEAQELIALARWRQGDPERARAEYELYLKLYPQGAGAGRAREALLTLAPPAPSAQDAAAAQAAASTVSSTLSGSLSSFYYGGQSKIRTQDFQDSPLSGLPELVSDATLSGTDQKQLISSVDLNWRRRDADGDLRFVLRDTYSADLLRSAKSKNKLSALYVDYRLQSPGLNLRLGRQSPTGAGVMGRFDGVQGGWRFRPKWRLNAVLGQPSDSLLNSKRHFYGASIDADELAKGVGGSLYVIEQRIDGEIDRRGVGSELRVLAGGLSASAMLDYDTVLRGLNIGSLQGTWQSEDNLIVNALFDRRATPMLMLGNSLFFQNPVLAVQATRLQELLASQSLALLRQQVHDTTAYSTQAMLGVTKPINTNWQIGGDVRLTNIGALLPVPDILPAGQPGTGNIWSVGLQAIATNLYSARDTHVLLLTLLKAPTYNGKLLSYNNSSTLNSGWQLDPSIRFYVQDDNAGTHSRRWAPGLRLGYRATPKLVVESEFSLEFSKQTGLNRNESSRRDFWYIGLRYDL